MVVVVLLLITATLALATPSRLAPLALRQFILALFLGLSIASRLVMPGALVIFLDLLEFLLRKAVKAFGGIGFQLRIAEMATDELPIRVGAFAKIPRYKTVEFTERYLSVAERGETWGRLCATSRWHSVTKVVVGDSAILTLDLLHTASLNHRGDRERHVSPVGDRSVSTVSIDKDILGNVLTGSPR